ncbi:MAG: transcriptional regulator, CdaR [Sporomusa sp.]|nr:transcriptional regulator, CdaR [Sporomusa sp.]
MIITEELAQHIVDHIMPLVPHNINIMDSAGLIIGSGHKNRLNTYHQGAMDVIRSGEVVEIFAEDIDRFPGALPGLNWPIVLGNQVVGVVGVSGNPELVRNTAKLVKMVTELILERESLVEGFRASLQLREQYMQLVLADHYQEHAGQIAKLAKMLRFNQSLPRLVAVVPMAAILEDALTQYRACDLVTTRTRENLTQLLEFSSLIDDNDLFVLAEDELIIIKYFPTGTLPTEFCQWGSAIIKLLDCEQRFTGLSLGIGSHTSSPTGLRESYKEAVFAQQRIKPGSSAASIYEFDLLISYLVREPGAIHSCLALRSLKESIYHQLDVKYDMRNTITTLLENNLNVSSAAKALFIHRNTMVFRLDKLKELTGLCPGQSLNHAMLCKILFSD